MNERIKLLAEQAGYTPLPGFDFANSLEEVFIKKFAELIVAECMSLCQECIDDGCVEAEEPLSKIKQHFGLGMTTEDKKTLIKELLGVKNETN